MPVLCAKQGQDGTGDALLVPRACYVRPQHMPASTQVANHAQLRELLDLAIDKGVRKFIARARAAGLTTELGGGPTDEERFTQEATDFNE